MGAAALLLLHMAWGRPFYYQVLIMRLIVWFLRIPSSPWFEEKLKGETTSWGPILYSNTNPCMSS